MRLSQNISSGVEYVATNYLFLLKISDNQREIIYKPDMLISVGGIL